ncbi:hypothetical protein [Microbacterium sp. LWH13-1.2]|uniref:hypothetical protein n=1 Tax=Microbacterium sp. LWH13-1.2 TaxID=3135260 RepID=UPI00313885B8
MDQNTGRTPHAEEPAEGSPDRNPEHNTAPDGQSSTERDELHGNAQGAAQGGAIQGDSSHGESPRGAIQGDASPDRDAALGGDKNTEEQLTADNEVEEDALRSLNPDDAPA